MSAQLPDKIIFNGIDENLYTNPLEDYWAKNNRKRPLFKNSSDCMRGYVAKWEINYGQLLLREITGHYKRWTFLGKKLRDFTVNTLFPKAKNKAVKASWFSGKLRIPQGKMMAYNDNGYSSRFEKEIIVTVEKGNVIRAVMMDCRNRKLIENIL